MTKQFYTYLYRDPKDNTPIYVGKGHGRRAWKHFHKTSHSKLSNTLRKRKDEGYAVEPIINYEVDEATAFHMEMFWIDFYGRADLGKGPLFNRTDGGEGTANPPAETRALWSEQRKGRKHSAETKAKMKASAKASARRVCAGRVSPRKGKTHTEEAKARISAAQTGKRHTEETKAKISAARRERSKEKSIAVINSIG
jgi:NUMOD3 motif